MPAMIIGRRQAARIAGTGAAFPKLPDGHGPWSNEEVVAQFAAEGRRGRRSPEEIVEVARTLGESLGIERRSWAHRIGGPFVEGEATTVDLQTDALKGALGEADIDATDLAAVITATSTPARITGANAPQVAARLGARCAAFDLRTGCSGGLMALVQGFVHAALTGQPVAVSVADTFSKIAPPSEPLAPLAFGDAGAAAVIVPVEGEEGLLSAVFEADGELGTLAAAPAPFPVTSERIEAGLYFLSGDPEELARQAEPRYADVTARTLAAAGLSPAEVDLFVPHQTSQPAIEAAARAARVDMARTVVTVGSHGNCGTAGVLLALDAARRDGRLEPGTRVLCAALGGGLGWGAALLRT